MTLGDANWEANNGRLSSADRWRYALSAVGAQFGIFAKALQLGGHRSVALNRLNIDRIKYPDTACAKVALEKLEELSSPAVANHSHRSYIWASLLGQLDGKRWDSEILYVSMMLHDLGLTESLHGSCQCAECFTLDAVNGVPEVFLKTTAPRAELIRRAVLLHININVPGEVHGWEAHYVRAGTSFDVVGQRFDELPPALIQATLGQYPRLNLKQELADWIARESKSRPGSRMAMLRRLGFVRLVNQSPYAS